MRFTQRSASPFCRVNNRDITDLSIRPDWCPLMDLPEKDKEEENE